MCNSITKFSILNISYDEEIDEIIYKYYYNIGIAVDTINGLMVPAIKLIDKLDILQIAIIVNDLIIRTCNNKIKFEEMKNSSFTITNFGSVGIEIPTTIINYPEVAILRKGIFKKKVIVDINNKLIINSILPLSLTTDHRLIDGADGCQF